MRQKIDVRKRRIIRAQFRRFRELCPDIPSGKVHIFDGTQYDPPDVCIGDGELGIEFTAFFHDTKRVVGSELKASETIFGEVVQEAQKKFEEKYKIPLWVYFSWQYPPHPNKKLKSEFIDKLVTAVADNYQTASGERNFTVFAGTSLENYHAGISILRLEAGHHTNWDSQPNGYVDVGVMELKPYVQVKETKLQKYQDRFKSVWLVIVVSPDSNSSDGIPDYSLGHTNIASEFERVYFLNMHDPSDFEEYPDVFGKPLIRLTGEGN